MNQTVEGKLVIHEGDARGNFDNLLTLANSVALLESEEKSLEAERSSLRIRARFRLTQIRRQARQPMKRFEDLCIIAKRRIIGMECKRNKASISEFLKKYNERFQQPSAEDNIGIIPQPDAQKVIQVKTIHEQASMNNHIGHSLEQMLLARSDSCLIARYYRMVRMFERRKHRFAKQLQWKAYVQTTEMQLVQQWWLWYMMSPQIGQDQANQQWALYLSYVDKEQKRMAAQLRRARKIEEQRSSMSVHQEINNHHPEQSHFLEGPQQSYLGTGPEQVALPVDVKESFQHPIIAKESKDQHRKLQQQTINVEVVQKTSSVEPRMRLTQLKREARLKNSSLVGKKICKKLGRQKNKACRYCGN